MTDDEWIGERYRGALSTQSYGAGRGIEGVQTVDLRVFSDEGGDFCEVTRFLQDGSLQHFPGYRPAQISYSYIEPGAVKAWHLHRHQDDLWFVPPGTRLLVGLFDVRQDSPSFECSMRVVLGAGRSRLIYIPRGVAHGMANLTPSGTCLLYFSNHGFDAEHPDEHRLPWDLLGQDFWSIRPG